MFRVTFLLRVLHVALRFPEAAEALVAFSKARVMFRVMFLLRVLHVALRFPRRILKRGEEISCHL